MKFTIERSKWARGTINQPSLLLSQETQCKCCLGHFATACGIPDSAIKDVMTPYSVKIDNNVPADSPFNMMICVLGNGCFNNSQLAADLIYLNDSPTISEDEREQKIKEKFAENCIEVEFL